MRKLLSNRSNRIKFNRNSVFAIAAGLSLMLVALYPLTFPQPAHAAVTEAFVRFDRLETGTTPITGSACMETSTVGTETGVTIVFPTGWTIDGTPASWTVTTSNLPTDAAGAASTAWPGIGTATTVDGLSVTFPSTTLANDTTFYCFNFSGASSTIGSAGDDQTGQLKTEGGSPFIDTVDWATSIVTAGSDQITVTASVSATMSFALSGNSVDLGQLSNSASTYDITGITQTISTNARNGWISWVDSANAGLDSAAASDSIDSGSWVIGAGNIVDMDSTSGYVLDAVPGTGTPTIATEYDGDDNSSGGNLDTQFRQVASAGDPANGDIITLHAAARSEVTTAAASDYTDTLTIVAAGSF